MLSSILNPLSRSKSSLFLAVITFFTLSSWAIDTRKVLVNAVQTMEPIESLRLPNLDGLHLKSLTIEEYFERLFQWRLSLLSVDEQIFLKDKKAKADIKILDDSAKAKFGVDPLGNISLHCPSIFWGPIFYVIFFHEIEHSLQTYRLMKSLRQSMSAPVYVSKDAEILFNMEKSAMIAEWVFLNNLPESLRVIYNYRYSIGDPLNIFWVHRARVFQNSQLNVHEYLRREWAANRYGSELIFENRPSLAFPTEEQQLMIKGLYTSLSTQIAEPKTCDRLLTSNSIIFTGNSK